jgi:hypothetical protein
MFKRILRVALLSLLMLMVIGLPVLAVGWTSVITVNNASASDYTNLPVIVTMNNTYLAANGYTSASMLDVLVKDGVTTLPFMPVSDKSLVVLPSIGAGDSPSLVWTSGNAPVTYFQIITGKGGYITVPDNATIELGDNFVLRWSGYIDTGAGANKDIFYKQEAFRLYVSSAGNISASILGDADESIYTVSAALTTGVHTITVTLLTNVMTIVTT